MINLLDSNDFNRRWNNVSKEEFGGYCFKNEMYNILKQKLRQGLNNKELIFTQELRNIGKTYSLIEFAKEMDLSVIVMSGKNALILKEKYKYNKIYSQDSKDIEGTSCVVDECVNVDKIIKDKGIRVLTGFSDIKGAKIKKDTDLLDILNNEIDQLVKKIEESREYENWGTYKNLIISLGEIMRLRDKEEDKQKLYKDMTNIPETSEALTTKQLIEKYKAMKEIDGK